MRSHKDDSSVCGVSGFGSRGNKPVRDRAVTKRSVDSLLGYLSEGLEEEMVSPSQIAERMRRCERRAERSLSTALWPKE